MRIFFIVISLFLFTPAFAQGWSSYANARYGATADVPPGFEPAGPEAHNSDGLIFRNRSGSMLTIYGAEVPGRNFEAFIAKMMANETSYNGWPIAGSKITPDWAEYWGSASSNQLRVRILASCNGRQAVVTRFQFNGNLARDADRIENSLKAGPANSC
jgi:hypothetical protein